MTRYTVCKMIAGLVLIAATVVYRLLPVLLHVKLQQPAWLPNFSPMAALCLCGAAFLPRRLALVLPFAALFGTDIILNSHYGVPLFTVEIAGKTIAFAGVVAIGWMLRKNARTAVILPAVLGSSFLFYLTTNTASWLYEPAYAKTATGWLQALTTGLPGYPQTWTFYRNTLVSDMLFAVLFLSCLHWSKKPGPALTQQPAAANGVRI